MGLRHPRRRSARARVHGAQAAHLHGHHGRDRAARLNAPRWTMVIGLAPIHTYIHTYMHTTTTYSKYMVTFTRSDNLTPHVLVRVGSRAPLCLALCAPLGLADGGKKEPWKIRATPAATATRFPRARYAKAQTALVWRNSKPKGFTYENRTR